MILVITTRVLTTCVTITNKGDVLIKYVLPATAAAATTTTIKAPVVAIPPFKPDQLQ